VGAVTGGTDWSTIYRRYVQLQRAWSVSHAPEPVARQFFHRIVHGHQTESAILREFRSFGLEPPRPDVLREAFFLQSVLYPSDRKRPDGRHPDDPMENVYAAALSMLPHGFWVESPDRGQLYRGQRDVGWPTIPKLFREKDVSGALKQLAQAIPRIQACLPTASEEQRVAVAQHFSKELGVATWLLDMTWDPRVALFFASDGGVTDEIGVVVCVVQKEWNELSAAGTNRLGRLRVIDVPGVLRIEHQRGSFLDTSHPELFDQYVAHTVWFRQVDGMRFEDPDADFPVTAERIYPTDDPVRAALLSTPLTAEGVLHIAPAS
jgi:FRG domain